MSLSSIRLLACTLSVCFAALAFAQTPAAAPALGGNPVPGVCLLSRQAIFTNARIGIAASARLTQLGQEAQAEVDGERKPIDAEVQAYQAEQGKLTPAQRQTREQALGPRLQAVQAKAQQRGREIEVTREKAMAQIANEAQPVIAQVYKAKGCGMLVDRNSRSEEHTSELQSLMCISYAVL